MRTVILFCLQAEQGAGLFNAVKACAAVHAEVLLQHPLFCTIRLDHHKAVVLAEQVFQSIIYQHGYQPRPNGGRGNAGKIFAGLRAAPLRIPEIFPAAGRRGSGHNSSVSWHKFLFNIQKKN